MINIKKKKKVLGLEMNAKIGLKISLKIPFLPQVSKNVAKLSAGARFWPAWQAVALL